jgi:hypothetical protein
MTGSSQDDYANMMLAGGRSVEGNRSKSGKVAKSVKKPAKKSAKKPAKAKVKTRSKSRSKRG